MRSKRLAALKITPTVDKQFSVHRFLLSPCFRHIITKRLALCDATAEGFRAKTIEQTCQLPIIVAKGDLRFAADVCLFVCQRWVLIVMQQLSLNGVYISPEQSTCEHKARFFASHILRNVQWWDEAWKFKLRALANETYDCLVNTVNQRCSSHLTMKREQRRCEGLVFG